MTMLSDALLTRMRADVAKMLPDSCTIQRKTTSVDAYGNSSDTWSTQISGAACRLDPQETLDKDVGDMLDRETSISIYRLTLAYNVDIQYGDRVVLGGDTYEIAQISQDHSWRVSTRTTVVLIESEGIA